MTVCLLICPLLILTRGLNQVADELISFFLCQLPGFMYNMTRLDGRKGLGGGTP